MDDRILIGEQWYVAAKSARSEDVPQVLKYGDTFGLFDRFGDVHTLGSGEQGLYHDDTRFLSRLELRVNGQRPMFLGSAVKEGNNVLIAELMNPDLMQDGRVMLPKGELHVFRAKLLWDGCCYEHIRLTHFGREPVRLSVSLGFAADFVDLFEVRGTERARRGQMLPTRTAADEVEFGYRGLDGLLRKSVLRLDPRPQKLDDREAHYTVELQPQQDWHLYCTIACDIEGEPRRGGVNYDAAYRRNNEEVSASSGRQCGFASSNPLVNSWLVRSRADISMLNTALPTGPYPYAGVPWYSTTFGRDGIITAREMLWVDPSMARGVLAFLAHTQSMGNDPAHDAEPGKILHEARKCEMARTGEVPFGRYYGTVDATPLFVALAGAYWERTGDLDFIRAIWPNVLAALEWMDRWGDQDGDGFIEYARTSDTGLVQQGWKDSHDSVFHADGRMARAPIALCEVQAYAYEARHRAAALAHALGDSLRAHRLREQAKDLQHRFQKHFWLEDLGCYAIALDADKQPCRVVTSNAGHALWCGIASPEHAARMAERLMQPDVFSGWGIRTVAEGQARYNPMAYHNGSIWPHDNALVAIGLARYGHTAAAMRVLTGLFDSSLHFSQHRLPELFCGFPRRGGEGPTLYPVACSPQAWASGAVFGMLQACLGLEIDAAFGCVSFRSPRLPEYIDWLEIRDLNVGAGSVDLLLKRYQNSVGVEVMDKRGEMEVRVTI